MYKKEISNFYDIQAAKKAKEHFWNRADSGQTFNPADYKTLDFFQSVTFN